MSDSEPVSGEKLALPERVDPRANELKRFLESKAAALAAGAYRVKPERLIQFAVEAAMRTPDLLTCSPVSVLRSLALCAKVGLEPNAELGHAYLVPRWNGKTKRKECVFQFGYKGLIVLADRSGRVARVAAEPFYQDEVDRKLVSVSIEPPDVQHKWSLDVDRSDDRIAGVYAIVVLDNGEKLVRSMTRAQVNAVRDKSPASERGPWVDHYAAMVRKTGLRHLLQGGTVPLRIEDAEVLSNEDEPVDEITRQAVATVVSDPAPAQLGKPQDGDTIAQNVTETDGLVEAPADEAPPKARQQRKQQPQPVGRGSDHGDVPPSDSYSSRDSGADS